MEIAEMQFLLQLNDPVGHHYSLVYQDPKYCYYYTCLMASFPGQPG